MATTINAFNLTFVARSAPKSGPTSSDAWNDSVTELATDFTTITQEWNNKIVPLLSTIPGGLEDTTIDAFAAGLDGKTIWVDHTVDSESTDDTYYNVANDRPVTIYEAFNTLYTYVNNQLASLNTSITAASVGLTAAQKTRIGDNVFNNLLTSTSSSLDGKAENNRLNVIQLAADLYGPSFNVTNTGAAQLTNSVFAMVDALLTLHNGNWDDDITLNHTGSFTAAQTDISTSAPGNDAYAASPSTLADDLNQIRTRIRTLQGTAAWTSTLSALYAGGADSLSDLLTTTAGTGTKTASNPWGYNYTDVDGVAARFTATATFVGQSSSTDSTPSYSSTTFITNGNSLETAVGKLDSTAASLSGLIQNKTLLQLTDTPSSYTSQSLKALRVNSGENAIEFYTPDHGILSGLTDDDHTQYLLASGTRAMVGDLRMGGNSVSGVFRLNTTSDVEVETIGSGIIIKSPNGTRWRITVDNSGVLGTTSL